MTHDASPPVPDTYGHDVPPFRRALAAILRAAMAALPIDRIRGLERDVGETARQAMADYLGDDGLAALRQGLETAKGDHLASTYRPGASIDAAALRAVYPAVMAALNNGFDASELRAVLDAVSAEQVASQSLFLGVDGRRAAFVAMRPEALRAILDHTEDWVMLVTGRQTLQSMRSYACTLEKQERVNGKLQEVETIRLKNREHPRAVYMKWLAGPFKGRELVYNEALLGRDVIRVREGGLLGVIPVTIGLDSAVAKRGTNHLVTEVGFAHLLGLVEKDYRRAAPAGHLRRVSHGLVDLDGREVYRFESILPRDRAHGYYCHRMVHDLDYLAGLEVRSEVYDFEDRLAESYHYRDVEPNAPLGEADFDPKNRGYRLG
jgi:hypothetical protein